MSFVRRLFGRTPAPGQDPARLFFLTTFLQPRLESEHPIMSLADWKRLLGEDPRAVTRSLEKEGLLVRSNLATHLERTCDLARLRVFLRERGLSTSGNKEDLILHLVEADSPGMWEAVSDVRLLEWSEAGRKAAEEFLHDTSRQGGADLQRRLGLPEDCPRTWIKWLAAAALGGIVGNRADAALKQAIDAVGERVVEAESSLSSPAYGQSSNERGDEHTQITPAPVPGPYAYPTATPEPQAPGADADDDLVLIPVSPSVAEEILSSGNEGRSLLDSLGGYEVDENEFGTDDLGDDLETESDTTEDDADDNVDSGSDGPFDDDTLDDDFAAE